MGSIMSAINDDISDWEKLKRTAEITDVTWDVYSPEAAFASTGYKEAGYTGARLKLHVMHKMEINALKVKHMSEIDDFYRYEKLKEKFE